MDSIALAFITGLTTGGISCLAVQGGLLASSVAQQDNTQKKMPIVGMFLAAKIVAYTLLGFLLGLLGSKLTFSPQFLGWMQIFAGLFMLVTIGNLLNLHPVFRYFVIQPPKFAYKLLKKQTRAQTFFAPAVLGSLTVLIPCGVTQAMMILAIASGNPVLGAIIMFAFTLGTSPVFAAVGLAASQLFKRKSFVYIASAVIFYLALVSINGGQILRGSNHTAQNYWRVLSTVPGEASANEALAAVGNEGKQEVTIQVGSSGYTSDVNTLKAGVPVKLTLVTNNTQGCSRAFTIPSLRLSKVLPETGTETIEFTPTKTGNLTFTCSMGMYSGAFRVI